MLCSENETKVINSLSGQNLEFCNVKLGGTYSNDQALKGYYDQVREQSFRDVTLACDIQYLQFPLMSTVNPCPEAKGINYEVTKTYSDLRETKPEAGRTVLQTCSEEHNNLRHTEFVGC